MPSFMIEYTQRFLGRERHCTGHYVTFEYSPTRDAYRAIVRPLTALGLHAVELRDITNLRAFSDWLAQRARLDQQQALPRLASEIPLPRGEHNMCQLAGSDATPYT